jgi:hypothetical protein
MRNLCLSLLFCGPLLFATACMGGQLSEDALAEDLKSVLDEQVEEQKTQKDTTKTAWNAVKDAKVGNAREIDDAKAALKAIEAERDAKKEEINAPVKAAEQELETAKGKANGFKGIAHYSDGGDWCGGDGCGGACSDECAYNRVCYSEHCRCVPQCGQKQCGKDGCGGVCGDNRGGCPNDHWCNAGGQCVAHSYRQESCEPSCNYGGRPAEKGGRFRNSIKGDKTLSSWEQKDNSPSFQEVESLGAYIALLDARAALLQKLQAAHLERAAKIVTNKGALEAVGLEQKGAEAVHKELKKAFKSGETDDGSPAPSEEMLEAQDATASALKKTYKEMKKNLKELEKAHRKEEKKMKKYAEAEARIRLESMRIQPIGVAWKMALQAQAEAQGKVDAAKAAIAEPLAKLEEAYAPRIAEAQQVIDGLEAGAFSDAMKAIWDCSGPTCPTQNDLIRHRDELSLKPLKEAVSDLYEARESGWMSHQEDLAEQNEKANEGSDEAVEEGGEAPAQLKEYTDWGEEVKKLDVCLIQLEELIGANDRMVSLRNALHEARSTMGK